MARQGEPRVGGSLDRVELQVGEPGGVEGVLPLVVLGPDDQLGHQVFVRDDGPGGLPPVCPGRHAGGSLVEDAGLVHGEPDRADQAVVHLVGVLPESVAVFCLWGEISFLVHPGVLVPYQLYVVLLIGFGKNIPHGGCILEAEQPAVGIVEGFLPVLEGYDESHGVCCKFVLSMRDLGAGVYFCIRPG